MKIGKVIATDKSMATIECFPDERCTNCDKYDGKGACERCGLFDGAAVSKVVAYNSIGASVGDFVEYKKSVSESFIFFILVFVLPLISCSIAYLVTAFLTEDAALRLRISLLTLAVVAAISCSFSFKRMKNHCDYSIKKIMSN
jgi:hypothetical protein